ncbi:uncharacterized protein BDR25DRAFT_316075 [Lindgomyces ingoldianus]|uniref:Uncharacterized protein n=1 Tax=Lindgomyces ingoldianus TaxID=673940 RepID=A0ACB6QNT2_9PLEO|nr:uncharacterized protein BDR25DRAFT_316075 [Lindgomyces ingoldianus]KAF2468618.1 hypothetical protein BDR25DRAFT_316075 [Lindgomyces ingoldianus]
MCFRIIPQASSWGRLKVTKDAMETILSRTLASPSFYRITLGFCCKIRAVDDRFYEFAAYPLQNDSQEKHGRDLEDPWSIRHAGIQHTFHIDMKASSWLILRGPQSLKDELLQSTESGNPMMPHLLILFGASKEWRWYLNYLEDVLLKMSDKVCYYDMEPTSKDNYNLDVRDIQNLQYFQSKLLRLQLVARTTLSTCRALMKHGTRYRRIYFKDKTPAFEYFRGELESQISKFQSYHETLTYLLQTAKTISQNVDRLLTYLAQQSTLNTTYATHATLALAHQQSTTLVHLAKRNSEETTSVKTITYITILYLPATLVATLFGTNFIALKQAEAKNSIVGTRDIWLYPAVVVPLTLATMGLLAAWEKRQRGKEERFWRAISRGSRP